jgi:hypothetical protein
MVAAFRSFTKLLLLYYVLSSFVNTHYSIFIFMFMVNLKAEFMLSWFFTLYSRFHHVFHHCFGFIIETLQIIHCCLSIVVVCAYSLAVDPVLGIRPCYDSLLYNDRPHSVLLFAANLFIFLKKI